MRDCPLPIGYKTLGGGEGEREETRNSETYFKQHCSTAVFLEIDGGFSRKKYVIREKKNPLLSIYGNTEFVLSGE